MGIESGHMSDDNPFWTGELPGVFQSFTKVLQDAEYRLNIQG
jgi:hypothetical protein